MIPILYAGNEKDFLNNGLGRLSDAIKCTVEEERNGIYELEMTYPITGVHYADIQENNIIYAPSEDGGVNQAFIIYKISKPINGIVTINAQHISYLLNGFIVMPYTATSIADALNKINANAVPETGFTFTTDILLSKPFKLDTPRSIRSLLGGESGSLLDVYGGHDYYFNNFTVSLLSDRGHDNGVTIRYGKNLTDLNAVSNTTNVYTGIVPYWMDSETGTIVFVDDYVVYSEHATTYPYKYIKCVDFSMDFEEAPSKAQLFASAESYLASNDGWKIKNNIEVSFVSLADTEEYKNIAPLERVKLCDTVTVEYSKLGISFKTKVIRTVYNVLLNRYDSIELGDTTYTLAQAISQANDTPTLQETTSAIQSAVQNATKLIRGGYGGHVVMMANANGLPEEILIMDTEDITTAEKVWRWNLNGLGYSDDGYDGPYGTAITMDGQIVANFITAGVLNAGILRAGIISDEMGLNSWNLETGELHLSALQHEYLGNVFNDITLWHNDGGTVPFSYETVNDVKYLVLDCTNATALNWANVVYTKIRLAGGSVPLKVHFVYYIDRDITTSASQRFPSIRYKKVNNDAWWYSYMNLPAQSIPANTEFTWDITLTPQGVDATQEASFGFYPIIGCKIYFKEIVIASALDTYTSAGIDFAMNGLSIVTEEVKSGGVHDFMPYDIATNADRWNLAYDQLVAPTIAAGFIVFDGTGIVSFSSGDWAMVESDILGNPPINISITVKFNTTYTISSQRDLIKIKYDDVNGSGLIYTRYLAAGTYEADTEYSFTWTINPSTESYGQSQIRIVYQPSVIMHVKTDISVSTEVKEYNSAAVKITPNGLSSVVQRGNVISAINQSAEQVTIEASKIDLTGDLDLHGTFTTDDSQQYQGWYCKLDAGSLKFYGPSSILPECEIGPTGPNDFGITLIDPLDNIFSQFTYNAASLQNTQVFGNFNVVNTADNYAEIGPQCQFLDNVLTRSGSVQFISDRRKKRNIKDLALKKARSFIMALKPRKYKFTKDISKSNRFHHGFIAQEVRDAMPEDWGIYTEDKKQDFIGLRYDEFLADMVAVIQDQEKRIEALERAIHDKSNN